MSRFFLICIFALLFGCSNTSHLPSPYNKLKTVKEYDDSGWYYNCRQMKKVLKGSGAKTVIEVGSWLGQSTRHIARNLPKDGKIYAVDHWLGSSEHQKGQQFHREDLEDLYEQFLSNVIRKKLTHKIIPIRMRSTDAAAALTDVKPDIVYIDAGHETEEVYKDLCAWYPYVQEEGILCGDDWTWPTVRKAVELFAKENNLKIESDDNFWQYVRN